MNHIETNQLICSKDYLNGFHVSRRSPESVRHDGYNGKRGPINITIVFLLFLLQLL